MAVGASPARIRLGLCPDTCLPVHSHGDLQGIRRTAAATTATRDAANGEKGAMFFPYLSNNTITAVELYTSYMIERKSLHVRRYSNFS